MKKIILLVAALAGILFAKSAELATPPDHKDGVNHLELVLILDKSGSMSGLESDTIGGFNSMIEKERKEGTDASVTTVLFDTKFNVIHDRTPLKKVENLTSKEYYAGGNTALLDAVGSTIARIERVPDIYAKNNRVLFVIITDGQGGRETRGWTPATIDYWTTHRVGRGYRSDLRRPRTP